MIRAQAEPKETQELYRNNKNHKWQGTYPGQNHGVMKRNEIRAGGNFENRDSILPKKLKGTYKKFDVTNGIDSPRFVRDTKMAMCIIQK
ncbi:hypothetical protein [Helicobacter typhlonius]|uniref:hypothetical protein n=1 Tax=Helicobacter typhlonius TaxID=76936 RepID=UPI002FE2D983